MRSPSPCPGSRNTSARDLPCEVAQTVRIDIALEVGSAQESVTVNAEAPLLKTESGELSHNVTVETLDTCRSSVSAPRLPAVPAFAIPPRCAAAAGTYVAAELRNRVNGAPGNTASYRVEGQDATNGQVPATQAQTQPSVDAIQEVAIQTSNFAAEYGQVGGGFFNYTMKSGTNQLHGSAYDYFVNEALNAATPWVNAKPRRAAATITDSRSAARLCIPKIYNGHDKTFFFFNFEQFRETRTSTTRPSPFRSPLTAPVISRPALTGRNLCPAANPNCDPWAAPSWRTRFTTRPRARRAQRADRTDPFPNNTIPAEPHGSGCAEDPGADPRRHQSTGLANNGIYPYSASESPPFLPSRSTTRRPERQALLLLVRTPRPAASTRPLSAAPMVCPPRSPRAIGTFILAHVQRLNFD